MSISVHLRGLPRRRNELGLLCVAGVVIFCASLLASLGVTKSLPRDAFGLIAGMILIAVAIQALNRWLVPDADPIIMPIVLFLNGIGYVMIQRVATAYPQDGQRSEGVQQLAWTLIGIGVYALVLFWIRRSRDLERYRYLLLVAAFILLVSPLAPKFGREINGARLWVGIGTSIQFQPVEIAKLLLVIFFASYFVEKRELLTIPTRRVGNHLLPDLRSFGPIAVAGAMSLLIILVEHDIGFSLLLFVVFLSLLWVSTGRWTYVVIGLVVFIFATFIASHVLGQVNQRIEVWLDPWKYYNGSGIGYQPVQGELAFGRGGLSGTGLGLGQGAGLVPAPTSDFIFAIIGEELGLTGTVAIMGAFVLLCGAGLHAALRARSEFAKLVAVGLTGVLGFQAFFIVAGVVRLLPLTGVTLPFVSYGGSSLVANYALVALLMRISNEANQAPDSAPIPAWSITPGAAVIGAGTS